MLRNNNNYTEHNLYTKYHIRVFNNTNNISKHIHNYSTDTTNNYKANKINKVKKTYYSFNDDITLNKTGNNYSNDTYNTTKKNNLFNMTDNNFLQRKIIQAISLIMLQDITITIMNTM